MTLRDIYIDLLYIFLLHGISCNTIENTLIMIKKCISSSSSRKIVMDIKYLYNVNSSEPYCIYCTVDIWKNGFNYPSAPVRLGLIPIDELIQLSIRYTDRSIANSVVT